MIVLALFALVTGQAHAWLAGVAGPLMPDPYAVLVAFVGLHARKGSMLAGVVVLGWARALTLAEPAGGHVLATGAVVLLLASQRDGVDLRSASTLLVAAFVAALGLVAGGALLRALSGAPLEAGWALVWGAVLALPLAVPARLLARRMRKAPA